MLATAEPRRKAAVGRFVARGPLSHPVHGLEPVLTADEMVRLLQLRLIVENGVHLPTGVVVELDHLPEQIKAALNGLLLPDLGLDEAGGDVLEESSPQEEDLV